MEHPLVVVVGGGILQRYLIVEAQAMGLRVLCTDRDADCPGAALADIFVQMDTYDTGGHHALGQYYQGQVAGVVTAGADVAPSVAECATGAGVAGIPVEVATRSHNKFQVRRTLSTAQLDCYQPRVSHVDKPAFDAWVVQAIALPEAVVWQYIQQAYQIPLPWVIKPLEERAARGVSIVTNYPEYQRALRKVAVFSSGFLVEEQLTGTEHSVEVIFGDDGAVLWFHIVDRYFDYTSGVPIELGHVNPTCLGEHTQQQILYMMLACAKALGITWGPFKIDCMMTADGPKVLECTARLSGGFDSQWSSPATGRHPMRLLVQLACGLPVERQPSMAEAVGVAAVPAILATRTGTLAAWPVPQDAGAVVYCLAPGARVAPATHNGERAGYVLRHGQDYDDTWQRACASAHACAEAMVLA